MRKNINSIHDRKIKSFLFFISVLLLVSNNVQAKIAKEYIQDLKSNNVEVFDKASEYLNETEESYDPTIVPALIDALEDSDPIIRKYAVLILGQRQVKRAISGIVPLLQDEDENVRCFAAEGLTKMIDEESIQLIPYFIEALKDTNQWVRSETAKGLGIILKGRGKTILEIGTITFIPLPKTPHISIGTGTVSLNQIKEALINLLNDDSPSVRINAILALGNLGDTSVIPFIKRLVKNDVYARKIDASCRGGKKGEKIIIYPVREEAERVIKLLEEKKKEEMNKEKE